MYQVFCDADSVAIAQVVVCKDDARLALCKHHFNKHIHKLVETGWQVWSAQTGDCPHEHGTEAAWSAMGVK